MFLGISKLNKLNCGLCGPDKKLLRATFGPRAVCCARLLKSVVDKTKSLKRENPNVFKKKLDEISFAFFQTKFQKCSSFDVFTGELSKIISRWFTSM
jgi:hypothetical protein